MKYTLIMLGAVTALGFAINSQAAVIPKDVRESVCGIGVGALEDVGVNYETLKKIPAEVRNSGLKAIQDFLSKNQPAEIGKQISRGRGGYPAEIGTPASK